MKYSQNPAVLPFLNLKPEPEDFLKDENGTYEVLQSGRLDCPTFIKKMSLFLKSKNCLIEESFNQTFLIHKENQAWGYKNITAKKIIFCEGYKNIFNSFFNWIPFTPSRGVVLDIFSNQLNQEKIFKKGITLIPSGNNIFKAGSTYERDDLSEASDASGRKILEEKLKSMLKCEYKIERQFAGIRPGTKDRNPVLGRHPLYKDMYILNGFGSRGVLLAPHFAGILCDFIEQNVTISKEFDLKRFYKYLKTNQ